MATSPQQDAANLRTGTLKIYFTFNQEITPINLSLITINDKLVTDIEITANSIQLTCSVDINSSYTVYVGKGAIANIAGTINEAMWINKHTGRYPAINNFDYGTATHSVPHPNSWMNYADITPVHEWAKSGGIVSAIFDPSSADYAKIITDIDEIANWMKPIAELGIPIIWHPMHEAQGNWTENNPDGAEWRKAWFWWGKDGPEAFVELWHYTIKQNQYDKDRADCRWQQYALCARVG